MMGKDILYSVEPRFSEYPGVEELYKTFHVLRIVYFIV